MEQKRICTICKIIKPFSEFFWDNRINIPFSRCKICYNERCRKFRMSKKGKKTYKKWEQSPRGKEVRAQAMAKWRNKNPDKRKAQTAVSNALRKGKITRLPCAECGHIFTEAHHFSYAPENWLNVIWLCKFHHTQVTYKKTTSHCAENDSHPAS